MGHINNKDQFSFPHPARYSCTASLGRERRTASTIVTILPATSGPSGNQIEEQVTSGKIFLFFIILGSIVKLITLQSRKRFLSLKRFCLSQEEDSEVVGMEDLGQLRSVLIPETSQSSNSSQEPPERSYDTDLSYDVRGPSSRAGDRFVVVSLQEARNTVDRALNRNHFFSQNGLKGTG